MNAYMKWNSQIHLRLLFFWNATINIHSFPFVLFLIVFVLLIPLFCLFVSLKTHTSKSKDFNCSETSFNFLFIFLIHSTFLFVFAVSVASVILCYVHLNSKTAFRLKTLKDFFMIMMWWAIAQLSVWRAEWLWSRLSSSSLSQSNSENY